MPKYKFDNGVEVIFSPYRDNYGESWEESLVCYPVLGEWEFVVGFEVEDKKPIEEWRINYLGSCGLKDGKVDVRDFAAGYGNYLGTQTLTMLPDEGLYVERVWEWMQANEAVEVACQDVWGIAEQIDMLQIELEDPTPELPVIEGKRGELASLRDELVQVNKKQTDARRTRDECLMKDPTFTEEA